MTPSITAWPPTRVSSPPSRMGIIWVCRNRRYNERRDTKSLTVKSIIRQRCAADPSSSNPGGEAGEVFEFTRAVTEPFSGHTEFVEQAQLKIRERRVFWINEVTAALKRPPATA